MSQDSIVESNTVFDSTFRSALQLDGDTPLEGLAYGRTPTWDSVAHLQLIAELEEAFALDIDAADVLDTSSYARLRTLLRDRYGVALAD